MVSTEYVHRLTVEVLRRALANLKEDIEESAETITSGFSSRKSNAEVADEYRKRRTDHNF